MRTRHALTTVIAAAALVAAGGCQPDPDRTAGPGADGGTAVPPVAADPETTAPPAWEITAVWADLGRLQVRAEDTGAHYRRTDWGDWHPVGDGCDTRDRILRDQGRNVTIAAGCRLSGTWVSPYDGATVTDPAALHIDHRVPLKEAHQSGARHWTRDQRELFYNDQVNLVAVTTAANTTKGDKDPGQWRPPHSGHWCAYAAAYITTKHAWGLSVDQREHDALTAMLRSCGREGRAA